MDMQAVIPHARLVWNHIHSLSTEEFRPFNALAGEDTFSTVASGLGNPDTIAEVRQRLQELNVPLLDGDDANELTQMAVSAINTRIVDLRGN